MAKKIHAVILISLLLSSCISIKKVSDASAPQQDFVTATLPPTQISVLISTSVVPSETAVPTSAKTSLAQCTDTAILLRDVTIPDNTQVKAGETFTKTWEFQNTGTCSWTNYTMKFSSGDKMDAPVSTPIPDTPLNSTVQVSVDLTAPATDGRFTDYFTLLNSKGEIVPIGTQQTFWVRFIVGNYVAVPTSSISLSRSTPSGNCTHGPNANYVNEVVSLINEARANAGLNVLSVNRQLTEFAQHHAEDMAFNNFLSHDGTDGIFSERMRNSSFGVFSEILAIGTPQNAMDQWQRDEHWDFVLNAGAAQIGVGYAHNSCSDYGGYFTVDFQ